jgi:predicted CoA-binding protein
MNHDGYPDDYVAGILRSVKTIAVVGASPNEMRPSFGVTRFLKGKGYDVVAINPGHAGGEIAGCPVFATLADVPRPIDMVDVFRNSEAAGAVVDEAIAVGAKVVWMQLGVRNDEAAARAEAAGIRVVMNRCPKIEWPRVIG